MLVRGLYTVLQRTFSYHWLEERSDESQRPWEDLDPTPNYLIPIALYYQFLAATETRSGRRVTEADRALLHQLAPAVLGMSAASTDGIGPLSTEQGRKLVILHRAIDGLVL